jgi:hypothetical protein
VNAGLLIELVGTQYEMGEFDRSGRRLWQLPTLTAISSIESSSGDPEHTAN